MSLSGAQLITLKAAIVADASFNGIPLTSAGANTIRDAFNAAASPAYVVWRSAVSRSEVYNTTSAEATTWNWTTYKAQAVAEQNAWTQMFMGDQANMAQANLRAGVAAIFGAGNAQTTHILAVAKRNTTRAEKLFASGSGTTATPSTMTFEGLLTSDDVQQARELP